MARKQHHEEHADESWLIPYADILTLLLALFIVLFASSTVDAEKYQALREGMSSAFNVTLPEDSQGGIIPLPFLTPGPEEEEPTPEDTSGPGEPDPELKGLFDALVSYVAANEELADNLGLSLSDDGVLITLSSDVWFASGSDELTPEMSYFAGKLCDLLLENQRDGPHMNVVITGHTDTDKVRPGGPFQSNWDLSVARAYSFMKVMIANEGFDPTYFSMRGYGEYRPIAPNDTPENKQRNRRVEVLVSLDKDV